MFLGKKLRGAYESFESTLEVYRRVCRVKSLDHVPFDGYLSTGSYDEQTQYSPANLFREDYTSDSFCSEADKVCSVTGIATEPLHCP